MPSTKFQDRKDEWRTVTYHSEGHADEDLEVNAHGEYRLRITRNSVRGGNLIIPMTRAKARQWAMERLLPACLRKTVKGSKAK